VALLYGISAGVVALGLLTMATGRIPHLLRATSLPQPTDRIRLDGAGLVLLGLFMLLTALASGRGDGVLRSWLLLAIWLSFTCAMLVLRVINRRLDATAQKRKAA
jgi:multisubunit Na+/H+ antiporter MnhB subunit